MTLRRYGKARRSMLDWECAAHPQLPHARCARTRQAWCPGCYESCPDCGGATRRTAPPSLQMSRTRPARVQDNPNRYDVWCHACGFSARRCCSLREANAQRRHHDERCPHVPGLAHYTLQDEGMWHPVVWPTRKRSRR